MRKLRLFVPIGILCFAGLFVHSRAQSPAPPAWMVEVDFTLVLDDATTALYQQCANTLGGYTGIPAARPDFYSAVDQPPDYVINGWLGFVTDVQPLPTGGYTVTVRVCPQLSSTEYGPVTVVSGDYSERYTIDANNHVQYLDSLDPEGMSGQVPDSIEGA